MTCEVVRIELPGVVPDAFLELSAKTHANDPRFIPEDTATLRTELSAANPWFEGRHARAFFVPGQARLAVYFDPALRIDGRVVACFGDFVSMGDADAERALFAAAASWAREQGASSLIGPIHMSTHFAYRAMLSMEPGGLPFPGEPYNGPELAQALERNGLSVVQRYQSQVLPHASLPALLDRVAEPSRRARTAGYVVRTNVLGEIEANLPAFYERNLDIFRGNYAFTPVPEAAWAHAVRKLLARACPHTSGLAWSPSGELAGFLLTMPHWGPLVVQSASPRFAVHELRYAEHFALLGPNPSLLVKTLGVAPMHRKSGVGAQLLDAAYRAAVDRYDGVIHALMREDNPTRKFGGGLESHERWYALFGCPLEP